MNSTTLIFAGGNLVFLLMAIHLFTTATGNRLLNRLLALALFSRFTQISIYLLMQINVLHQYPIIYTLFNILTYLGPGCLFLYIVVFTNDQTKLTRWQLLFFLPVLFALIDYSPWFFADPQVAEENLKLISTNKQFFQHQNITLLSAYNHNLIRRIVMMGTALAAWPYVIYAYRRETWTLQKKWIYFLTTISTLNQAALFIHFFRITAHTGNLNLYQGEANILNTHIVTMLLSFIVLIIKPELLYGHLVIQFSLQKKKHLTSKQEEQTSSEEAPTALTEAKTEKRSPMNEEKLELMKVAALKLMEEDKLYLNPNLQITDLAGALGIPVHHCSYLLNYTIGKGFRDFINAYRIEYFIEQFPKENHIKTVEAIAQESGFKNIATFYNSFKKEKGTQPYEFLYKG